MPGIQATPIPRLPSSFPLYLRGPQAWTGSDFEGVVDYVCYLSEHDIAEIEKALRHFQSKRTVRSPRARTSKLMEIYLGLGISRDAISKANLSLPADVSAKLKSLSHTVHNSRGFVVLRGIQPSKYTEDENVLIYGGISSHVAEERTDMTCLLA
ncbi:hypothetical protein AOQ84DRAFT_442072 [Glonium stellatum]|uniref:Uncharacterized protein n=1 Tax=Glonium stellatum TaxID=574774 RepID=A0A8E2ETP1_9PEZI|nr:hypothetical protein AOQ84DRAFT_442072 [Glonium stellatum]